MRLLALVAVCAFVVPHWADEKSEKRTDNPEKRVDREDNKPEKKLVTPQIGHMVFFKLKNATAENRSKLVEACNKYLSAHDGVVYYSAGVIGDEFKREVNDRDWDVALHLVFASKAAHDKYQDHADHKKFIEENKDGWEKVRVFDSEVIPHKHRHGEKKKVGEGDKPDARKSENEKPGVRKSEGEKP